MSARKDDFDYTETDLHPREPDRFTHRGGETKWGEHSTHLRCVCGHPRLMHGDVAGDSECRRKGCSCLGWRPDARVCRCGTSWDADGPTACPPPKEHDHA